jgi:hypothetical protein
MHHAIHATYRINNNFTRSSYSLSYQFFKMQNAKHSPGKSSFNAEIRNSTLVILVSQRRKKSFPLFRKFTPFPGGAIFERKV